MRSSPPPSRALARPCSTTSDAPSRCAARRGGRGYFAVKVKVAGEASMLPAASMARTFIVCLPFANDTVLGEVQAAQAAASSLHWNVDPASSDVKVNVADTALIEEAGPEVIVVFGAVVSTTTGFGNALPPGS